MPFSVRGTGISFQPATAFAHSSNEPVQPLGTGITLDNPLANDHAIDAVVRDAAVTTAGYQGTPAPNQWFGGPALSPRRRHHGAARRRRPGRRQPQLRLPRRSVGRRGLPSHLRSRASGCRVPAPGAGRGGSAGRPLRPSARPIRSAGRFPDGADTDSNCTDFLLQAATTLPAASAAGANNIKVASVADFAAGQTIMIDTGANRETAVIATVGTAGATTVGTATDVGATVIPVASAAGFTAGQTITIDSGANQETAVVASVTGGGEAAAAEAAPAPQSPSRRRSSLRTRPVHRSPAPASPSPLH